jgi:hypothetical protein
MLQLAEVALAVLFILWSLATVVVQPPSPLRDWFRRSDVFALIPCWHFFAPTPGMSDFSLVYRDQAADGSVSPWREVTGVTVTRQPFCALWNPGRRHTKAMLDITKELMQLITQDRQKWEIELSVPYLSLLNYISALPRHGEDRFTQFGIVMSSSSATADPPVVVFVSSLHAIV